MPTMDLQIVMIFVLPVLFVTYVIYHNLDWLKNLFARPRQLIPAEPIRVPQYGGGQCAVCLNEPKRLEVSGTCGHSFCGPCLFQIFDQRGERLQCPLCRRPITTIFRNFPERGEDRQYQEIVSSIQKYNRAFSDDRSWWRRLIQFPYVWRMIRRGVFNPRFLLYFLRSAYFFRWIVIIIVYIIMPLDIIPEKVFGIIGFIDDLFIAIFALLFMLSIAAVAYIRIRAR